MVNESISNNLLQLKDGTHSEDLLIAKLFENNVLNEDQRDALLAANVENRVDLLYDLLLQTSDTLTPLIIRSLQQSKNDHLQIILEGRRSQENFDNLTLTMYNDGSKPSKPFWKKQEAGCDVVDAMPSTHSVKLATRRLDRSPPRPWQAYKMGSRPKGYALLINIERFPNFPGEDREGSELDVARLEKLFRELGYEVEKHVNLTGAEIFKVVEAFAKQEKHKHVDSCLVFIMSHGTSEKEEKFMEIQGTDKIPVSSLKLINCFVYPQSEVFGCDKPILFFFQACRGYSKDFGQPKKAVSNTTRESRTATTDGIRQKEAFETTDSEPVKGRKYDHMLIVNACVPGYVSMRYSDCGAWFVDCLVRVFQEHAHEFDIDTMLSMVDSQIRGIVCEQHGMQTTTIEKWGFTKKFYFNPGLYDDDETVNITGINVTFGNETRNGLDASKGTDTGDGVAIAAEQLADIAIAMPQSGDWSNCGDLGQSTPL